MVRKVGFCGDCLTSSDTDLSSKISSDLFYTRSHSVLAWVSVSYGCATNLNSEDVIEATSTLFFLIQAR